MAEEAVSFSPANLRKTITPVASFQVDTEIHKRKQDLIKVNTDCTINIKSNNTIQKNIHCKQEDAFILFGYQEWSLCSIVRPFHNTIVRPFNKFKS